MDTKNNLAFIYSQLNEAFYYHIRRINIEGKPETFNGELCKKIIDLSSNMQSIMEEIYKEMNKGETEAEVAFFKSHPELNP